MMFPQQVRNKTKSQFQFTFHLAWGTSYSTNAPSSLLVNNWGFFLSVQTLHLVYFALHREGIAHSQCLLMQLIIVPNTVTGWGEASTRDTALLAFMKLIKFMYYFPGEWILTQSPGSTLMPEERVLIWAMKSSKDSNYIMYQNNNQS